MQHEPPGSVLLPRVQAPRLQEEEKGEGMSTDVFHPPISLLAKLGSIAVHAEEMLSPGGHSFDRAAIEGLLTDAEVMDWIGEMSKVALVPVKRKAQQG